MSWGAGGEIAFPPEAMALQAAWKEIDESEKARYLWIPLDGEVSARTQMPVLCGLVGLDVKSRILRDWFWLAFEHVDNPGRCDVIGCRDDFGQEPAVVPPAAVPGGTYPPRQLTARLLDLLPLDPASVWHNYRLKGIQTSFTEADGRPTFLGNSAPQLEGEFLPEAMSCMTCHARASFDRQGRAVSGLPVVHGVPKPGWFYVDSVPFIPPQLKYKQSNFIWSVAADACPKTSAAGD